MCARLPGGQCRPRRFIMTKETPAAPSSGREPGPKTAAGDTNPVTLDLPPLDIDLDSQFLVAYIGNPTNTDQLRRKVTSWREFPTGVRLGRIAREGEAQLVLYEIPAGAPVEAFGEHEHPGGELYYIVEGSITDETGSYGAGCLLWLGPRTVHAPRTNEYTVILVFWPRGVRMTQR